MTAQRRARPPTPVQAMPFLVVIRCNRSSARLWSRFANREQAEGMAARLRQHGFDAIIEVATRTEQERREGAG